ncbi:hypothetical protein NMY22_g20144 [Coprinellus aureogranulatus]|nr:hypothetical protein NMY22_g20144 [Coprinellus aureogranulatus]
MTKHKAGFQNTFRKPLRFPVGFNISTTPLVTFRRVDVLFTQSELVQMHKELHPEIYRWKEDFELFGEEAVWTMSPEEYLGIFTGGVPEANYRAMVVSTAGHWTTGLFHGYHLDDSEGGDGSRRIWANETEVSEPEKDVGGWRKVLMEEKGGGERWAEKVQSALDKSEFGVIQAPSSSSPSPGGNAYPPSRISGSTSTTARMGKREVVVRAYLPGHEDCHSHRTAWEEIVPFKWNWYNWGEIWRFNRIFENVLQNYANVHFLKIDRPGRLRPDAHASGDCLHIMSGAGVLEGWSHYIWHYLTREV